MTFDPQSYGPEVGKLLNLSGKGHRLIPLVCGGAATLTFGGKALARVSAEELFPGARHPVAAMAGLWVYFSCFDEAHKIAQDDFSTEGSYWHAILHRQEPDDWNSGYWFRRVGAAYPIYPALAEAAAEVAERFPEAGFRMEGAWDPQAFIAFCAEARANPGSPKEQVALEIQRAEWQLLFDYCAAPAAAV